MLLRVKSYVCQLVYASKSTSLTVQCKLGIKISDQIKRIVTRGGRGGSEKGQKSVTYYLNGPI